MTTPRVPNPRSLSFRIIEKRLAVKLGLIQIGEPVQL